MIWVFFLPDISLRMIMSRAIHVAAYGIIYSFLWLGNIPLSVSQLLSHVPPGSSVHVILQARILEWIAIPFSRESSQPMENPWFNPG